MKQLFTIIILCITAINLFARDEIYKITSPIYYPGTKLNFAYVAWNCISKSGDKSHCFSGKSFTPMREKFFGADYYLNENGVCKALGYERALPNSSDSSEGSNGIERLQVDSHGNVVGSDGGRSLTEITCINKSTLTPPRKMQEVKFFAEPTDSYSKLPYCRGASYKKAYYRTDLEPNLASDEDSICKRLGYKFAAASSSQTDDVSSSSDRSVNWRKKCLQVYEDNGEVIEQIQTDALSTRSIICIK